METSSLSPAAFRDGSRLQRSLQDVLEMGRRWESEMCKNWGLSPSQCRAILTLGRGGPGTVTELGARLFLEKSTVSRLVKGLQKRGLMRKRSPSSDERKTIVQLTEAGGRIHRKILNDLADAHLDLAQDLDPATRACLPGLLEELAQAVKRRTPSQG